MTTRWARHAVCWLLPALPMTAPAFADYRVISPYEIDLGEIELETNGSAAFDRALSKDAARSETMEFGTGLTPWYHFELELGFERPSGASEATRLDAVVAENTVQLTEPGEGWADWGVYYEYAQSVAAKGPNTFTFGPVVGKDIGRTGTIVNVLFTRQLGPDQGSHGLDLSYAVQTRWRLWEPLSPAVEVYGDLGSITSVPRFNRQQFLAGPVAVGAIPLLGPGFLKGGRIKYELGYLFGATGATQAGTLRWRMDFEIPF